MCKHALKQTAEYMLNVYSWKRIPLQYLPHIEEYQKKIKYVKIKLNKELFKIAKSFDFAEICITSGAEIINDENISDEIAVETSKAEGEKCSVCWKIKKGKCLRHG